MLTTKEGGRMDLHNRTTAVALVATALIVVLAGFGCDSDRVPPVGDLPAADGTITTWVEYASPTLGITIPYPEGWSVRTEQDGRVADFYDGAPPEMSDAPSDFWSETQQNNIEVALAGFVEVFERTQTTRSGKMMTRVVYPYDAAAAPDVRMVAYLWEEGNTTHMVGGPEGSSTLEYVIDHVGVRR